MSRPPAVPMQAFFGPGSGTVGRSPDCTLSLPDEARHVSRQQARIDVVSGAASITCLSAANGLIINGQELRQGQSRRLVHGDSIHVSEYELRFEETEAPVASQQAGFLIPDDPFALPEAIPAGLASSRSPSAPARQDEGFRAGGSFEDPFSGISAGRHPIPDVFGDFGMRPAGSARASGASSPSGSDPLGLGLRADPMAELAAGRADSIDTLFDLKPGVDPLGPDSPLGRPSGEKPPAAGAAAAGRAGNPVADNASILSGSFRLPQAIPPTEFGLPENPVPNDQMPDVPVVSWKERDAVQEVVRPPAPLGNGAISAAAAAGDSDLLRALLLGLGLAELPRITSRGGAEPQPLTPELMRRLGGLLATACEGTVGLLQARATLKQELRADLTMVQSRDNNPLKFVPDGQTALNQLLAPQMMRGFMEPQAAMRDAFDDLLAHQIGFVAGMRAAMQGLLARFEPQTLETRLAGKSVLDALLPAARKARLWELFNTLYSDVSREAEDDFGRLFGRAFVEAYEEQIARIEAATHPQGSGGPAGRAADLSSGRSSDSAGRRP